MCVNFFNEQEDGQGRNVVMQFILVFPFYSASMKFGRLNHSKCLTSSSRKYGNGGRKKKLKWLRDSGSALLYDQDTIIFHSGLVPPNYCHRAVIPLLTLMKAGYLIMFASSISQLNFGQKKIIPLMDVVNKFSCFLKRG